MAPDVTTMTAIITGGVVLGLFILVGLPVFLGIRHARRVREFEHAERMKALELGRPLPGDNEPNAAQHGPLMSSPAAPLGVWLPLGALGIAWLASGAPWVNAGTSMMVWGAAGAVGLAGVICGTILHIRQQDRVIERANLAYTAKQPAHDPDAFDVVSRRG